MLVMKLSVFLGLAQVLVASSVARSELLAYTNGRDGRSGDWVRDNPPLCILLYRRFPIGREAVGIIENLLASDLARLLCLERRMCALRCMVVIEPCNQ